MYQKFFLKIKNNKNFIKYFIGVFQIEVKKIKKKSIIHENWNSYDDLLNDQNFPWKFPPNPSKISIKRQDSHRIQKLYFLKK